jgi:FkbM family methyltransferase
LLQDAVRRIGIAVKRAAPPGSPRYRAIRRVSWLLPRWLRANYEDDPIAERLHRFACRRDEVFFVQVGAHDAQAGDPIALYVERDGWRGVLVEPVREVFARLRKRYANRNDLAFENAAVAETDGTRTFYRLDEKAREAYELADQLGSLQRDVVLGHAEQVPNIDDHLEKIEVPCVSFPTLLRRHDVDRVDLLHLDTEGYDAILLRSFPWEIFQPRLVLYEHKHLDDAARQESEDLLDDLGYDLTRSRSNTLAELREPGAAAG